MQSLIVAAYVVGQVLVGGSTGKEVFAPTGNVVLDVPDGGRIEYATITIPTGVTVTFNRNARNDPVMLLAAGDVVIAGTVHVNATEHYQENRGGRGGPGGFDGGDPGFGEGGGSGKGPGGGTWTGQGEYYYRCSGANSTKHDQSNAMTYGSKFAFPLIGGSGGCGSNATTGGNGGGGAILIASETKVVITGSVQATARGDEYPHTRTSGLGAGGTIRLVAPAVSITGTVSAAGYSLGYLRIDTIDKTGIGGTRTPGSGVGYSVGSNMVVELPQMPKISLISAAGIQTNGKPFFHTLPPGSAAMQPIEYELLNFAACNEVKIRVVPSIGPSTTTTVTNVSTTVPVVTNVAIPANVPSAVEVYGKQVPCAG